MTAKCLFISVLLGSTLAGTAVAQIDANRLFDLGLEVLKQSQRSRSSAPRQEPVPVYRPAPAHVPPYRSHAAPQATAKRYSAEQVGEVQRLLNDLGYDPGPIDGAMGPQTAAAIRDFETDSGIPPTGRPSAGLIQRLRRGLSARSDSEQAGATGSIASDGGPSFDCAKAVATDEIAICASPDLAAVDRTIKRAYESALSAAGPDDRARLVEDQRNWLAARASCGGSRECITAMMDARLAVLGGDPVARSASAAGNESVPPVAEQPQDGQAAQSRETGEAGIPATAAERPGLFLLEGRVAASTYGAFNENLRAVLFPLVAPHLTGPAVSAELAVNLIDAFDEESRGEIFAEAFEQPYDQLLELYGFPDRIKLDIYRNPFIQRRAADAVNARLDVIFGHEQLDQPVRLKVFCKIEVGTYDFSTGSFPIRHWNTSCDKNPGVATLPDKVKWVFEPIPDPDLPPSLAIPLEQAEALDAEIAKNGRFLLVSYNTEMSVSVRGTEAGPIATVSYTPPASLAIHRDLSLTELLMPLESIVAQDPPSEQSGPRTWDLPWDEADSQDLIRLAGAPQPLPADGRALATASAEPLGVATLASGTRLSRGSDLTVQPFNSIREPDNLLSLGLGLPREHLAQIAAGSNDTPSIVALLPRPAADYSFTAAADLYGRQHVASETELRIRSVHRFTLPGDRSTVLIVAEPIEGRFLTHEPTDGRFARHSGGDVIERFDLESPPALPHYDTIPVASRAALMKHLSERFGLDTETLFADNLQDRSGDVFDRQGLIERLMEMAESETAATDSFWVGAKINLDDYDVGSGSFPLSQVSVFSIQVGRALDLHKSAIGLRLQDQSQLAVSVPEAEARQLSKVLSGEVTARLRIRPLTAASNSYGHLDVTIDVVEAEIIDENATLTVRDPQHILYRYPFEQSVTVSGDKLELSASEAESKLDSMLESARSDAIIIRRADAMPTEFHTTSYDIAMWYGTAVRNMALDLPEDIAYSSALEAVAAFKHDPSVALLAETGALRQPSEEREQLISLASEYELSVEPFPPRPTSQQLAAIDEIWPAGADHAVIRRRDDDTPVSKSLVIDKELNPRGPPVKNNVADYFNAMMEAIDFKYESEIGDPYPSELSMKADRLAPGEVATTLQDGYGVALIVSRQEFEEFYPKLSDLDLIVRPFPPEKVRTSGKQSQSAQDFAILGISGGADEAAVTTAIDAEFGPNTVLQPESGLLEASRGSCGADRWDSAGVADEAGSLCLKVGLENGVASHVALRQVVPGDARDTALNAFRERFGGEPWIEALTRLEGDAARSVHAWGEPLAAARTDLGRIDAKIPTTALEAVIWTGKGVTTIQLHLDLATTVEQAETSATPEIKF